MDISKQLQDYEVEYHVLQDELIDSSPLSDNQRINKLEKTNNTLHKQNFDLLEELQVCTHQKIQMTQLVAMPRFFFLLNQCLLSFFAFMYVST